MTRIPIRRAREGTSLQIIGIGGIRMRTSTMTERRAWAKKRLTSMWHVPGIGGWKSFATGEQKVSM
jgi:hypothetical protein